MPREETGVVMVRVLLVAANELFGKGVEALVRREAGFRLVGWEADLEGAVESIRTLQPDAVVIVRERYAGPGAAGVDARLLAAGAQRVIALSLEDSRIVVDGREERVVRRVEDFFRAIEGNEPFDARSGGGRAHTAGGSGP
jgi:hypothetical protein